MIEGEDGRCGLFVANNAKLATNAIELVFTSQERRANAFRCRKSCTLKPREIVLCIVELGNL
jgi:hypothetical protein